ncbi:MAG: Do family serine endopeptidase [Pseudomonadota bacterium]
MKLTRILSSLLLPLLAAGTQAALPESLSGQPLPSLAPLVQDVSPAVVNIQVRSTAPGQTRRDSFRDFFGQSPRTPREMRSAGSGVIVDAANGYILTNHHVVANATDIRVTLFDDRTLTAEVIGSDEGTDVAVIKVDEQDLSQITIGDSDTTKVGDFVIAIGNPFGLSHTVTSGIVSALGRSGISRGGYEDFIQTDASINPGNSGGALVNLRGELVGINSAIISGNGGNVGIGFAIPSNMASSIMQQILDFGEVRRGLLGVSIDTLSANDEDALGVKNVSGAIVRSINPGSAAERAGLEVMDIITAVDGEKVDSAAELRNAIGLKRSGDSVDITALRDGRAQTFKATLDELNSGQIAQAADLHPGLEGASFANGETNGTVVASAVTPGSPAASEGLRVGDRVVSINRQRVSSVEDMQSIASANSTGVLFMEIERDGRRLLLRFVSR